MLEPGHGRVFRSAGSERAAYESLIPAHSIPLKNFAAIIIAI
jgi:hypothetical protein